MLHGCKRRCLSAPSWRGQVWTGMVIGADYRGQSMAGSTKGERQGPTSITGWSGTGPLSPLLQSPPPPPRILEQRSSSTVKAHEEWVGLEVSGPYFHACSLIQIHRCSIFPHTILQEESALRHEVKLTFLIITLLLLTSTTTTQ